MLKIAAIVSLMLIVATWSQADHRRHKRDTNPRDFNPGSTLWAASLSCDSCGSECTSACGTRHFRSCCFNYLRRKRGPETLRLWFPKYETTDLNSLFESAPPMHEFQNEYQQYGDDTFDPLL